MGNPEEFPVLILQSGPSAGERFLIPPEGLLIGRGKECDVVISDRKVSRRHARLIRDGSDTRVEDLGSKNGTWVNGNPVEGRQPLRDGDIVQIALAVQATYVASDATVPLTFEEHPLEKGILRIDPRAHQVWVRETEVDPPLSVHQYRLLELLYLRSGGIVTREEVIENVWPGVDSDGVSEQAIDALVRRLRERIGEFAPEREFILTVRGHGFRLHNAP
ncbi:MAG: FHA domain-containing protein [Anaerolineales bacterium]|jgi:predicted component of type VI protein secretion system